MNAATKARLANILTAIVSILAMMQGTFLTNPPLSAHTVFVAGTIFTYLTMALTTWKQYLSPDVNNTGTKVTIWVAIVATVAGLADLTGIVQFSAVAEQYVKWAISITVAIINILSKQLFPSVQQKDTMNFLSKY